MDNNKRGPSRGNPNQGGLGKGFAGVIGHSLSSTSSVNSRRGGGFSGTQNNGPARSQGLPAAPQFFSAVPLKHSIPQKQPTPPPPPNNNPPFSAGGGDSSSSQKDEKIRALEGKIRLLQSQLSSGNLTQQLSNLSEQLLEARISLKAKEDKIALLTQEKEAMVEVFGELREQFRENQAHLELLQERNRSTKSARKSRLIMTPSSGRNKMREADESEEKKAKIIMEAAVAANKLKVLELRIAELEKEILSYQEGFLESILLRPSTSRNSTSSSNNNKNQLGSCRNRDALKSHPLTPSSTDMHSFLRETIQKLKDELNSLNEDRQSLKSLSEGKAIECIRLERELTAAQDDLKRTKATLGRLEESNLSLTEERDSLRSHYKETIVPQLTVQVESLRKSVEVLERQLEASKKESIETKEALERDVAIEREKADLVLAQGIEEREGSEAKWRERWEEHTSRMKEEMVALRKEFEEPLRTAHVREERLRLALEDVEERYENSKVAWENYRRDLYEQVSEWKDRFGHKVELLDSLQSGKIELETVLQSKLDEVMACHEMIRRGLEERQDLEKRVEDLEERSRNESYYSTSDSSIRMPISLGGVSDEDLQALQAKMVQDAHEKAARSKSPPQPPPPPPLQPHELPPPPPMYHQSFSNIPLHPQHNPYHAHPYHHPYHHRPSPPSPPPGPTSSSTSSFPSSYNSSKTANVMKPKTFKPHVDPYPMPKRPPGMSHTQAKSKMGSIQQPPLVISPPPDEEIFTIGAGANCTLNKAKNYSNNKINNRKLMNTKSPAMPQPKPSSMMKSFSSFSNIGKARVSRTTRRHP